MQLNFSQAVKLLNVPPETMQRWIEKRRLPFTMVNDRPRFNRTDLLEWAAGQGLAPAPGDLAPGRAGEDGPASLDAALRLGGVAYGVAAGDRESALAGALKRLKLPGGVDRAFLLKVLLARESLGSTAVGNGVAVPHVRSPIILDIPRPWLGLCFLEKGVEFGSPDGLPVDTLFVMIAPTLRVHLRLLAELGMALQDPGLAAALKAREPRASILRRCRDAGRKAPAPRA